MTGRLIFDDVFDTDFVEMSIWDQLGKIQDSDSAKEVVKPAKFKPVNSVVTDDGKEFVITPKEAAMIKDFLCGLRTAYRVRVLRDIQQSKGLTNLLRLMR